MIDDDGEGEGLRLFVEMVRDQKLGHEKEKEMGDGDGRWRWKGRWKGRKSVGDEQLSE